MNNLLLHSPLVCLFLSIIFLIMITYAFFVFVREKEKKAASRALLIAILLPLPYFFSWYYNWEIVTIVLVANLILTGILFLIPFPIDKTITDDYPKSKIDERDIMFSRNELKEGSVNFENYYSKNPDKRLLDDEFRREPGLTAEKSIFYNQMAYAAANSSFYAVDQFKNAVDGEVNSNKESVSPNEMAKFIKAWSKKLGALNTGITELSDYHFYSHKGRGEEYGKEVKSNHTHAIAFTVEMTQEMVDAAPQASIVMESGQQYLEAGRIAVQIAQFLRSLGYSARAHIDGNYQVVCPLVARDSGLGEIGRMGLLMTPKQGPRVRLGVVTTDFKLPSTKWEKDYSVHDFCNRCKKCADVCPSKSISFDEPKLINGVKRWQINSESCFTYWCKAGTDCGRCMATCPYSHPNNTLHNFIRWGIKHSPLFRILAVYLDDFFYGRKPKSKEMPKWIPEENKSEK